MESSLVRELIETSLLVSRLVDTNKGEIINIILEEITVKNQLRNLTLYI